MNYEQAEKALRRRRPSEDSPGHNDYFEDLEQARNIVVLCIARNLERIANTLEKQNEQTISSK